MEDAGDDGYLVDCAFTVAFTPMFYPLLRASRDATNTGVKAALKFLRTHVMQTDPVLVGVSRREMKVSIVQPYGAVSNRLADYLRFRALADPIFCNPDYHKHVRKAVMKQLKEFRKRYEGYVPTEYKVYLKEMKRSGEWGDHLTLQATADQGT